MEPELPEGVIQGLTFTAIAFFSIGVIVGMLMNSILRFYIFVRYTSKGKNVPT